MSCSTNNSNSDKSGAERLYASFPRLWCSHLRLTRRTDTADDGAFTLEATTLYPAGHGRVRTPFEAVSRTAHAYFAFDPTTGCVVGLGLVGLLGEVSERQRHGRTIEEKAEVWFVKVD